MPFALLIIGLWLLIAGVRNTQDNLFTLVKGDFTGSNNFIFWLIAILIIGAIGYVPKLRPVSVAFLGLILVVLFLNKGSATSVGGGFFQQFLSGIDTTAASQSLATANTSNEANLNSLRNQIAATIAAEQGLMTGGSVSQ